jgi:hypothetical protein
MATMSYCRFSNTVDDLRDCYEHWEDEVGQDEQEAREELLRIAQSIVNDYGKED